MTPMYQSGQNETKLLTDIFKDLISQYQIEPTNLQAVIVSNSYGAISMRQAGIRPQSWLKNLNLAPVPFYSLESACAGGSVGLDLACQMLEPGGKILVMGVEYCSNLSLKAKLNGIAQGVPEDERQLIKENYGSLSRGSLFLGINEYWGRMLLSQGLATMEQIVATTVKSWYHGSLNPLATRRQKISKEDVMNSKKVSDLLTIPMCSIFADGAAGVIISNDKTSNSVRIKACNGYSGNGTLEYHERIKSSTKTTLLKAGVDIKDFDCMEIHDATSVEELYSLESLELFEKGEAGQHILNGDLTLGGSGPIINPSGGLVSRGHPIGATGLCQIYELFLQLSGNAQMRQIENASKALAINAGGTVSMDAASLTVTVLESS